MSERTCSLSINNSGRGFFVDRSFPAHTACLLKDIYSPGTLHMRMTRSIVPCGTEMSDSDDSFSTTAGNLPSLSLSDTSLSERRSMWTVSDNFLAYNHTVIRVGHLSTSHAHVQCASIRKSSLCTVQWS